MVDYIVDRIKTGIPGLDKLIQGGFVEGSSILVSGKAGCGKTAFCLQFLYEGLREGDAGLYMTLEQPAEDLKKDALSFGWDLEEFEKKNMLRIIERNLFVNPDIDFFEIEMIKAKRVVIDSVSILSLMIENRASTRNRLNEIITALKKKEVTILLVSEATDYNTLSRLGVEEYLADAVISLNFTPIGAQAGRSLFISKMRRTKHSENIHPIEIGKGGISVLSL